MRVFVGAVLLLLVYGCQSDTRLLQDQISALKDQNAALQEQLANLQQLAATAAATAKHTFAELQPLLDNRCFRTKTADEQKKSVQDIDALSNAEFKKTIDDLNSINAADRLLGTRGCEVPK
jgi:hypothetical protein